MLTLQTLYLNSTKSYDSNQTQEHESESSDAEPWYNDLYPFLWDKGLIVSHFGQSSGMATSILLFMSEGKILFDPENKKIKITRSLSVTTKSIAEDALTTGLVWVSG